MNLSNDKNKFPETVNYVEFFAASNQFQSLFNEGMALVEETANYLDVDGRKQSRELSRPQALAYASESMRLTTRLMQIASWLLLQRALKNGELSVDEIKSDSNRIKLSKRRVDDVTTLIEELPVQLIDLIHKSFDMQVRLQKIDKQFWSKLDGEPIVQSGARDQLSRLEAAFKQPD
ncbi:MAG: DUF1465 family protein [Rhizobiales bacterium]|nr:DUF1465 family protein [Hyphomicrobiales bacterium]NRB14184.1 DUF1465 family protein [Hyphomicrobiales bacterium]